MTIAWRWTIEHCTGTGTRRDALAQHVACRRTTCPMYTSNTQHTTPREKTAQIRSRAHTKRTSSDLVSAHEVQPRPSAYVPCRTSTHPLHLPYHSSVLLPIICLCQTRLRPSPCSSSSPPPNPSASAARSDAAYCITVPWVGTLPTDTRLPHPWSDGQRFSRWSLRCCAVLSHPHSSPPPQHEQLEFPMRLSLAQNRQL